MYATKSMGDDGNLKESPGAAETAQHPHSYIKICTSRYMHIFVLIMLGTFSDLAGMPNDRRMYLL